MVQTISLELPMEIPRSNVGGGLERQTPRPALFSISASQQRAGFQTGPTGHQRTKFPFYSESGLLLLKGKGGY